MDWWSSVRAFFRTGVGLLVGVFVAIYLGELLLGGLGIDVQSFLALVPAAVLQHPWTPLTYLFLHDYNAPLHIFANLIMLVFIGRIGEAEWGRRRTLQVFLLCALGSAAVDLGVSLGVSLFGIGAWATTHHLGASGPVLGLLATWTMLNRDREVSVFGIQLRAWVVLAFTAGFELWWVFWTDRSPSSWNHVGGLATGVIVALFWDTGPSDALRRWQLRRRRDQLVKRQAKLTVLEGGKSRPGDWVN